MAHIFVENPSQRFKRYSKAKTNRDLWVDILEQAYSLVLPNRNNFFVRTKGEDRTEDIFDSTAVEGVPQFSNLVQSIVAPPFRRWATLAPGFNVVDANKKNVEEKLQQTNDVLFNVVNNSNVELALNEAFKDMAVSTGVVLVTEKPNDDDPIDYSAIPIHTVILEGGPNGSIDNFWRDIKLPIDKIQQQWPKAVLTDDLLSRAKSSRDDKVELIEGTIFYHQNPPGAQYFYYVQDKATKKDILTEFRDFSPWVPFRLGKAPGEVYGRGPVLNALPFIRIANQMAEFELRNAKFRLSEIYLAENDGVFNPFNVRIEPGAILPVNSVSRPPIAPLPKSGDLRFEQLALSEIRNTIRNMLFMDPVGAAEELPNETATRTSIRQQNFVRRSTTETGRLIKEGISPLLENTLKILIRRGLVENIDVNGKDVKFKFVSPIAELQNAEDISRSQQWLGYLANIFGQQSLVALTKAAEIPEWSAEKFGVDLKLVQNQTEIQNTLNNITSNLQEQQATPEQEAGGPPELPPEVSSSGLLS